MQKVNVCFILKLTLPTTRFRIFFPWTYHLLWSFLSFPSRYFSLSPIDSSFGFEIILVVQTLFIGSTLNLVMPHRIWIISFYDIVILVSQYRQAMEITMASLYLAN